MKNRPIIVSIGLEGLGPFDHTEHKIQQKDIAFAAAINIAAEEGEIHQQQSDSAILFFSSVEQAITAMIDFHQKMKGIDQAAKVGMIISATSMEEEQYTSLSQRLQALCPVGAMLIGGASQPETTVYEFGEVKIPLPASFPEEFNIWALKHESIFDPGEDDYPMVFGAAPSGMKAESTEQMSPQDDRSLVRGFLIYGVIALVLMVLFWQFVIPRITQKASPSSLQYPAVATIGVLPFENKLPSLELTFLGDALGEDLANHLGSSQDLRVISWKTMQRLARQPDPEKRLYHLSNADLVLKGSLDTIGNKGIVLKAALISLADNTSLLEKSYEGDFEDLLTFREQLLRQIVKRIGRESGKPVKNVSFSSSTRNIDAYIDYLRGKMATLTNDPEELKIAIDYFKKALGNDPDYPKVHAGLGQAYSHMIGFFDISPVYGEFSMESSERAIELDRFYSEGYSAKGSSAFFQGEDSLARSSFFEAIKLNRSNIDAYKYLLNLSDSIGERISILKTLDQLEADNPAHAAYLASAYGSYELFEEAEKWLDRAKSIRKDYIPVLANEVNLRMFQQQFDKAQDVCEQMIALDSNNYLAAAQLSNLRYFKEDYDFIEREARNYIATDSSKVKWSQWGYALLQNEQKEEMGKVVEAGINYSLKIFDQRPTESLARELAYLYVLKNDHGQTLKYLETSIELGWQGNPIFDVHPLGKMIMKDPSLRAVLDSLNLSREKIRLSLSSNISQS